MQFWGKSQDTETARYVSALSGRVRVSWGVYEDDGGERAWKQMFSAKGAPYRLEDRDREGILPAHLHGLPKGWWYAYHGDPHAVELLIPESMYRWESRVLPEPVSCSIFGVPRRRSTRALVPVAAYEANEGQEQSEGSSDRRVCPGCERLVSSFARFCESCGGRL